MGNRFKEHIKIPTVNTPNPNAPYKHSQMYSHQIDYAGFELLDRAVSNFKLCINPILEHGPGHYSKRLR